MRISSAQVYNLNLRMTVEKIEALLEDETRADLIQVNHSDFPNGHFTYFPEDSDPVIFNYHIWLERNLHII